jgi:hypothetical protein
MIRVERHSCELVIKEYSTKRIAGETQGVEGEKSIPSNKYSGATYPIVPESFIFPLL